MISGKEGAILFIVGCLCIAFLRGLHNWRRSRQPVDPLPEPKDLSHHHVRAALTDFLARHHIIGDADIRDGRVYQVVDPTRIDPLWRLFDGAAKVMAEVPNGINGDLYQAVKNPGQGTGWSYRCSGVSVYDIGEAARLMQAVAGSQQGRES